MEPWVAPEKDVFRPLASRGRSCCLSSDAQGAGGLIVFELRVPRGQHRDDRHPEWGAQGSRGDGFSPLAAQLVLVLAAMNSHRRMAAVATGAALAMAAGLVATAQQFVTKAPTPADWAALGKLPDFNGVWERGGGGGGAARGAGAPGAAAPGAGGAAGAARGAGGAARGNAGGAPRGAGAAAAGGRGGRGG